MHDRDLSDLPPEVLQQLRRLPEQDFVCVACEQTIDNRWNERGAGRQIAPICLRCERVAGYNWNGSPRYRTKPSAGSFMDRRNATRILALADELDQAASRINFAQNLERHYDS